jgi:hypothetical protein
MSGVAACEAETAQLKTTISEFTSFASQALNECILELCSSPPLQSLSYFDPFIDLTELVLMQHHCANFDRPVL